MYWILFAMLAAGAVGGTAGHLANPPAPAMPGAAAPPPNSWLSDIVMGMVAAFCVPLFLYLTQSKLMDALLIEITKGPGQYMLYFGGFCLIAAFTARNFLQSVSGRLANVEHAQSKLAADNAELASGQSELRDEIADTDEAADKKLTTPTTEGTRTNFVAQVSDDDGMLKKLAAQLAQDDKAVLTALADEDYVRRSMTGLSRQADLSKAASAASLDKLIRLKLVKQGNSKRTGSLMYQLEIEGYKLARWIAANKG